MTPGCVHRIFERLAAEHPGRIALIYRNETISYGELNLKANRIAHALQSRGVGGETLVALLLERSPDFVACILGVLKAGGAYVPLDPADPPERLAEIIADADPAVLLTRDSLMPRLERLEGDIVCIEVEDAEAGYEDPPNPDLRIDENSLAYVMFTSGSTGHPKGVMIEHRSIVRLVNNTDYADFGPENVFLHLAPATFDASTFEIWGALLNGGRLVIMPAGVNSLSELGTIIRAHGVTTLWLTAGLFHAMVDERLHELGPLRQLLAGGDVLSLNHVKKVLSELDCDLINGYGPTENTTFTCCYKVPRNTELHGTIPIGKPIAGTRVYILDENLLPVADGEIGELYAAGEGLARGYLNRDDLTAGRFVFSPHAELAGIRLYRTGDLVRILTDGNLEFVGRVDNQIKIRGYRIELEEVEAALTRSEGVRQAVAASREVSVAHRQLLAFVVPDSNEALDVCKLRRHLEETLPEYMIPSFIFSIPELPLTPNGKVDRASLIRTLGSQHERPLAFIAPETTVERAIADTLEDILRTGPIGIDDNFFDVGASSLQLTSLHARLQASLAPEMRITGVFQNPTIRSLARSLDPKDDAKSLTEGSRARGLKQRAAFGLKRRVRVEGTRA